MGAPTWPPNPPVFGPAGRSPSGPLYSCRVVRRRGLEAAGFQAVAERLLVGGVVLQRVPSGDARGRRCAGGGGARNGRAAARPTAATARGRGGRRVAARRRAQGALHLGRRRLMAGVEVCLA